MSGGVGQALRLTALLVVLVLAGAGVTLALASGRDAAAPADAAGTIDVATATAPPAPATGAETLQPRAPLPPVATTPVTPVRARADRALLPHRSRALGRPNRGRLVGGVLLPVSGEDFFTWDLAGGYGPNPAWRRAGTDTLVAWLQGVLRYFRAAHPDAPRIGIGDLSLPAGGPFTSQYGGLGHASHQNGLDVDVLYPRRDRAERPATRPAEVDRALSQALVDTFVRAGARFCFVGLHVGLRGPAAIVQAIPHHDDHVHVRIAPLA